VCVPSTIATTAILTTLILIVGVMLVLLLIGSAIAGSIEDGLALFDRHELAPMIDPADFAPQDVPRTAEAASARPFEAAPGPSARRSESPVARPRCAPCDALRRGLSRLFR